MDYISDEIVSDEDLTEENFPYDPTAEVEPTIDPLAGMAMGTYLRNPSKYPVYPVSPRLTRIWEELLAHEEEHGFYVYGALIGSREASFEVIKAGYSSLLRFPGVINAFFLPDEMIGFYVGALLGDDYVESKTSQALALHFSVKYTIDDAIRLHESAYASFKRYKERKNNTQDESFPTRNGISAEKKVQLRLAKKLRGKIEVPTSSGNADIVTDTEVIEVKEASGWKGAIGQVIAYQLDFPFLKKRLHLFAVPPKFNKKNVEKVCNSLGISVSYE